MSFLANLASIRIAFTVRRVSEKCLTIFLTSQRLSAAVVNLAHITFGRGKVGVDSILEAVADLIKVCLSYKVAEAYQQMPIIMVH